MKIVQIYRDGKMNDIDQKINNKNVIKILNLKILIRQMK